MRSDRLCFSTSAFTPTAWHKSDAQQTSGNSRRRDFQIHSSPSMSGFMGDHTEGDPWQLLLVLGLLLCYSTRQQIRVSVEKAPWPAAPRVEVLCLSGDLAPMHMAER